MTSFHFKDKVSVSHLYMFEFLLEHNHCFILCFLNEYTNHGFLFV